MDIHAAVIEQASGPFALEALELDEPRPDEVLVRVVAAGICATDIHARDQHLPVPLPAVLGHEGAGIVERVGSAVTTLEPGDHVVLSYQSCGRCPQCLSGRPAYCEHAFEANFGGARLDGTNGVHATAHGAREHEPHGHFFGQSSFASYALATERNAVKVRDDVPLELLAPLGCGLQTGAGAILNAFRVGAGSGVAVFGVGAVGLAAVMAARVAGASPIIAVDVVPERLTLAAELGATHTVDGGQQDVTATIREIAGTGVDYVAEITGHPEMVATAVDVLAPFGTVGLIGTPPPGTSVAVNPLLLNLGARSVRGIVQGDAVPQLFIPRLIELYRRGEFPLDRLVRFYDFADINQAVTDMQNGSTIKPVLRIGPA